MEVIIVFVVVACIAYSILESIDEEKNRKYKEEKRIELLQKQEEEELKIKEQEEKLYNEEIIPAIEEVIELYNSQLSQIMEKYINLIENEKSIKYEWDFIQKSIQEMQTAIFNKDYDEINGFKDKITKYQYFINRLKFLCMEKQYIIYVKIFKDKLGESEEILQEALEEVQSQKEKTIEDVKKSTDKIKVVPQMVEEYNVFTKEHNEQISKLIDSTKKDVYVDISNFTYDEYHDLYFLGDLKVSNCSLNTIMGVEILLKIYREGNVIGNAYNKVYLLLKPGEEFKNKIEFYPHTNMKGDKIVLVNYKLIFANK